MKRALLILAIWPAFCLGVRGEVQPQTVVPPPTASTLAKRLAEEEVAPKSASTNLGTGTTNFSRQFPAAVPGLGYTSPNLRPVSPDPEEASQLELYQTQLELGRRQRQAADWEQAEACLTRLMAMPAPMEFHRAALLELGLLAQDRRQYARAQQIFSQYVQCFREDQSVPEVLLRQGLLYREMGATTLALSKFYAVMSSALSLKLDRLAYYQRMVLQAQSEIADTYYLEGKYDDAADYFKRLLKLENPELNREEVHYKLVRCCAGAKRLSETVSQAHLFAELHPDSAHLAEVRFLQADSLKQLGRRDEALNLVLALMRQQHASAKQEGSNWAYWQQRTGNELANQLYQEGDLINALEIYRRLSDLDPNPAWRLPASYQAALIYERLKQPQKAGEIYARIVEEARKVAPENLTPSLATVVEMSRWRQERLTWQTRAEQAIGQTGKNATFTQ